MVKTDASHKREIRSFARRSGRFSETQKNAISEYWSLYGIDFEPSEQSFLDLSKHKQLKLEIGFGNGDSLISMAQNEPESYFVGIEVHKPGVGRIINNIHQLGLNNLSVISHDAIDIMRHMIPKQSIDRLFLFFPDPWHKIRHHKRRIVNQKFRDLLVEILKPKGVIHMATDWQNYADHMFTEFISDDRFVNMGDTKGCVKKPEYRPLTKFEQRGQRLGHKISDLMFEVN